MHIRSDHFGRLSFIMALHNPLLLLHSTKGREQNSFFWADSKALPAYLYKDNLRINVMKHGKSHSSLN